MPLFTIAEPHPTIMQNAYMHSGRGGAGNYFRAPTSSTVSESKTTVTTTTTTTATPSSSFYSGRGGAGNARVSATRPVMSFDEELQRQSQWEDNRRVGYVGRGGAGNIYDATTGDLTMAKRRKDSDGASASSSGSAGSLRERVSSVFGRR